MAALALAATRPTPGLVRGAGACWHLAAASGLVQLAVLYGIS